MDDEGAVNRFAEKAKEDGGFWNVWIHCGIKKNWIIYELLIRQNGRNGNKEKEKW